MGAAAGRIDRLGIETPDGVFLTFAGFVEYDILDALLNKPR